MILNKPNYPAVFNESSNENKRRLSSLGGGNFNSHFTHFHQPLGQPNHLMDLDDGINTGTSYIERLFQVFRKISRKSNVSEEPIM